MLVTRSFPMKVKITMPALREFSDTILCHEVPFIRSWWMIEFISSIIKKNRYSFWFLISFRWALLKMSSCEEGYIFELKAFFFLCSHDTHDQVYSLWKCFTLFCLFNSFSTLSYSSFLFLCIFYMNFQVQYFSFAYIFTSFLSAFYFFTKFDKTY